MTYIPEIDFKRHLSVHMYSLLNGDTYSNDQKQSILKFRLILDLGNMQSEGGGGKKVQNQKSSKCYSQDQYLCYASSLLTAFLCHRHATFLCPYFTGSPSLIAMEYPNGEEKKRKEQSILLSPLVGKDSRDGKMLQKSVRAQQQLWPRKLNPNEKSAQLGTTS